MFEPTSANMSLYDYSILAAIGVLLALVTYVVFIKYLDIENLDGENIAVKVVVAVVVSLGVSLGVLAAFWAWA